MKRFNEENFNEDPQPFNGQGTINNININEEEKINNVNEQEANSSEDITYKRFEEKEKKDNFTTPSMKSFRMLVGGLLIVSIAYFAMFVSGGSTNYKSNLTSGKIDNVKAGDRLSKEAVKLDAKDFSIDSANSYGKIELSIWNFADKEDGDYVQIFVDGVPQTEPFSIRHKPIKVGVPDKAVIEVKGIRDGSYNGITYGVFFNKTGETYLNTVPLNAANTYALKTT